MHVVAVIGPSRAGKTKLFDLLSADTAIQERAGSPELLDLDVRLGEGHRSDACQAISLIRSERERRGTYLLVNVGAGQIVQKTFRDLLHREPDLELVGIWCDEQNFKKRHGPETGDREYGNNNTPELRTLWQTCRDAGRLVDTSCPAKEAESLAEFVRVLRATTTG